jgi:hypothetical protein
MRCTGQQGKDTSSRPGCLQGSKTLASTTAEPPWHLQDRSTQQDMENKQIALLIAETGRKGMG